VKILIKRKIERMKVLGKASTRDITRNTYLRTTSISSSEYSNSESNTEKEEREGNTGRWATCPYYKRVTIGSKINPADSEEKIWARDKKIWRYVGRLHNDIQNNDLISYMKENGIKGDITCEELNSLGSTKAFKVRIREEEAEKTDNENFWPKGVLIRPFRFPRRANQQGVHLKTSK
jgi:hypothetical protein